MNILFFLMPKGDVSYLSSDDTIRVAIKKMCKYKYTSIPLVDKEGAYAGTITEGDIFSYYREHIREGENELLESSIMIVPRHSDNRPVYADTNMEDLVGNAMNQNFVPVIDDRCFFIGIITRREIIRFLYEKYQDARKTALTD